MTKQKMMMMKEGGKMYEELSDSCSLFPTL